jgi:serine O-acetyltransferase
MNTSTSSKEKTIWHTIREEVSVIVEQEPILSSFLHTTILSHDSLASALSFHLANKLDSRTAPALLIREVIEEAFRDNPNIINAILRDLSAIRERDSACNSYSTPFLYFKGFHALQTYRIAHHLWQQDRHPLALFLQNQMSSVFGVDIHPAAQIGHGIMIDHATGVVIGETTVVGNNVSIMQAVTLGGTGKEEGDRHPKVADGVLISAGAKILGNITIGEGAKVGAGSVVLQNVPPHCTAAGVPAKIVGHPSSKQPALEMNHDINSDINNV